MDFSAGLYYNNLVKMGGFMTKKIKLIFILLVCLSAPGYCLDINIGGGLLFVSSYYNYGINITLGGQSYKIKDFEDQMKQLGVNAVITETAAAPALDLTASINYNKMFYYYAHIVYVTDVMYHSVYSDPTSLSKLDMKIDMPLTYFGAGVGIKFPLTEKFTLLGQVDVGYTLMNASVKQSIYDDTGVLDATQSNASNGSAYGFFINAGGKYYLTTSIYGMLGLNYNTLGSSICTTLSIGMDFDARPNQSGLSTDSGITQNSASAADLEASGDGFFRQKNYKDAFGKYRQALALDKKAGLYVKIGNCYYALGYKAQALSYYNYSLKLQDNPNVRAFILKISAK
jgi:tetratricopeptide (TPR) repeat protein